MPPALLREEIPQQAIIEDSIRAGWAETEVITATIEVADNLMLATGANAEFEARLRALKRKRE